VGKNPAFQFYPKDWLTDTELQSASASTRGIWINCLCLMWQSSIRGEIRISDIPSTMARIFNCEISEVELFLKEAQDLGFCDISVTRNGNVTESHKNITLRNRRMYREEKDKESNRLRQQKHREKQKDNNEITPLSPSPTPSPTPNINKKEQRKPKITDREKKIFEELKPLVSLCEKEIDGWNPWEAIQKGVNERYELQDMKPALEYMLTHHPDKPWALWNQIIRDEKRKRETEEANERWQQQKEEEPQNVADLLKNIGKPM